MTDILLDGESAGADLLALEGDNLTSLERLDGIEGEAGIVYLDPPYNTGSYDRTYRDAYGDGWEAFMRPRLAASRALLSPTGVLMVSIGEAEHPRLRLILDEMFGPKNRLATLIWSSGGRNAGRFTSGVDYLLVYARDRRAYEATGHTWRVPKPGVSRLLAAGADAWDRHAPDHLAASRALSAWWSNNRGDLPAGLRFYLRIDETGRIYRTSDPGSRNPANPNRYDILHPITGLPCRMPVNGWAGPPDTLRAWQKEGRLRFGADHTTTPQYVRYLDESVVQAPDPVIVSFRQSASKHVAELVGHREVGTPKDHRVLAEWFSIVCPTENPLIVDLFAGSGSTGDAVVSMNRADGGSRRCLLLSMNEVSVRKRRELIAAGLAEGDEDFEAWGMFRRTLMPRLQAVGGDWRFVLER